MIYNSAGHGGNDSGAVAEHSGIIYKESEIAILLRDGINTHIQKKGKKVISDTNTESLAQYLARIKPGTGSVSCEGHMNAFTNKTATGIEVIIPTNYDANDYRLASMVALGLGKITGLPLRNGGKGVITEEKSKRGKLGFLRKPGINILIEYGFISNPNDVARVLNNKEKICAFIGDCLILADDWLI